MLVTVTTQGRSPHVSRRHGLSRRPSGSSSVLNSSLLIHRTFGEPLPLLLPSSKCCPVGLRSMLQLAVHMSGYTEYSIGFTRFPSFSNEANAHSKGQLKSSLVQQLCFCLCYFLCPRPDQAATPDGLFSTLRPANDLADKTLHWTLADSFFFSIFAFTFSFSRMRLLVLLSIHFLLVLFI